MVWRSFWNNVWEKRPSTDYRALTSLKVANLGAHHGSDKNNFSFGNCFFPDRLGNKSRSLGNAVHKKLAFYSLRCSLRKKTSVLCICIWIYPAHPIGDYISHPPKIRVMGAVMKKNPQLNCAFHLSRDETYSGVCWKEKISITFPSKCGNPSFVQTARNLILLMKAADLSKFYELIKSTRDTVHFPPV